MSSIMRRRRGLISAIWVSCLGDWASTPTTLSDGRPHPKTPPQTPASAGSFNPPINDFLNGLRALDAHAAAALKTNGIAVLGPQDFGRPIDFPNGQQAEARFRTFQRPPEHAPGGMRLWLLLASGVLGWVIRPRRRRARR